ncbi:MAG: hypothetical protein AAF787_16535 [Chloroflexota bacterium]
MEVFIIVMYIAIPLYGIVAFFQRSAMAHFIASGVMTVALVLHSCLLTMVVAAGATVFGATWFMTSASGNTTEADVAAVEQTGSDIAAGSAPVVALACAFAVVLLGFAIAHFVIGQRKRRQHSSTSEPVGNAG